MLKRWIELPTSTKTWLIDLEFLLSSYECQWGGGCKGINPERPDLGCCANGAYLTDDDMKLLEKRAPMLTDSEWQRKGTMYLEPVREKGKFGKNHFTGEFKTALQNPKDSVSGCVFANDPDFAGGMGCALHIGALNRNESPLDWKPEICWQMPLMVEEIEEINTFILRMFHWELEADYPWFCEHDELMWVAERPVYQTMHAELKKLLDKEDPEIYELVKEVCDQAFKQSSQWRGEKPIVRPIPVTIRGL